MSSGRCTSSVEGVRPRQAARFRRLLAAALLGFAPIGCGVYLQPANAEPPPAREVARLDAALARDIVSAGNRERTRAGAPGLRSDAQLDAAARDFAVELARRGQLTHTSQRSGYETLGQRVTRAGASYTRVAENLAMLSDRADVPAEVVRMWLGSSGHRRNLLNPVYRRVGTGVAAGAGNSWYVVQVYAD